MNKSLTTLAMAAACLASTAAHAQYVGVGIGPSRMDINCTGSTSCDKNDTGFKIYGGWNLPGPFSVEAAYFDWGKANATFAPGAVTSLDTQAHGFGVDGAYSLLFGWGECMFRAGIVYNRAKTTTVSGGVGATNTYNFTAPHAGADCAYPFAPNWWATAGVDYSRVKYTAADKADVMLFTIGLRWK